MESEHLPPIIPPPANAFRHHLPNGSTSTHGFQLNNHKSSPTSDRKYIPKTMNTMTTMKKSVTGGPVISNGIPHKSTRTPSSESSRRVKLK
jgi:hypothetical protein